MRRLKTRHVAGVILGLLFAMPALAQTTGRLRGLVVDHKGAPLPGVVLVVECPTLGVSGRGAVTDASGSFQLPGLPSGRDYSVRASLPGFASLRLTDIDISAGQVSAVRLTLVPEAAVRERVEVRARPNIVDLDQAATQTQISSEFIDALPLLGRNFQDILTLAPGVSDVDGDGNPNIHGSRDTDLKTLVDGVNTTDPLTGKIGAQLNIESIQEIEIKTSGAPAEYGRAQGGFADIVTKSGGNEFQGTFKFFWRGSTLDGDGAGIDDPRLHAGIGESGLRTLRFNDYLPFLSLGGPIARDRAWFYLANEYISRDDPVNALNAAFLRGVRELREFMKLTWQVSPAQRLALSVNYDPQEYLNQGLNSFTRVESGFTNRLGGTVVTFKSTGVLSALAALETSVSSFDQSPAVRPNLDADTNGNGVLWVDRNNDGFMQASERDPGEDYDLDGKFAVFEDANHNYTLDPGEDLNGDGRLTTLCEGALREDQNCNGRLDPGEDRNNNKVLDDTPQPTSLYPYGRLAPLAADREYNIDRNTGIISGPYYQDLADERKRFTFRQDLSVFVPDLRGSHDLKMGLDLERESFRRRTQARVIISPYVRSCEPPSCQRTDALDTLFTAKPHPVDTVSALLPTAPEVQNQAVGLTAGLYLQDSYHPIPNLSLGFGLRFERERAEAPGYSSFDPALETQNFDRLLALGGFRNTGDTPGIRADPIFQGRGSIIQNVAFIINPLQVAALGRLTRHHAVVAFQSADLRALGIVPDASAGNLDALTQNGVSPQTAETFTITNNNLAPRLSVSWDPAADGRTKLFATWGRYFDKLFLSTIVGEQGPDWVNRYYHRDANNLMGNLTPDHGIGQVISEAPPSATQIDRGLATPFSDEFTVGFEREIAPEVALSLTYVDRHFRKQLQDIDVNHTLRFDSQGRPIDRLGGLVFQAPAFKGIDFGSAQPVQDGRPDLYIYDYFFNQILRVGNFNDARYRGLELALTRRLARRWQMQASYTYSRAVGSAEDFQSRLGNDPSTVQSEFGYMDFDQRHVVKLNAGVFLPRDWQLGTSLTWSSGLPYSIISRFFALDSVGYEQFRTTYGYTVLDPGRGLRFVPLHRNSGRNAAVLDVNVQARKNVVLGRHAASLSIEVFNLLNRDDLHIHTFEPVVTNLNTLSNTTNPTPSGLLGVNGERRFGRRFQIGFRYDF